MDKNNNVTLFLEKQNYHDLDKYITFEPEEHKYTISDYDTDIECEISSTSFIGLFFPKFEAHKVINNMMNSRYWEQNKYHDIVKGMTRDLAIEKIKNMWDDNGKIAADKGTILHESIEYYYNNILKESYQWEFRFFMEFHVDHKEYIPYRTEWIIYDKDYELPGTIDMVYIDPNNESKSINGETPPLIICDWKRSKEIKTEAYRNNTAEPPIDHIPDCNYYKYALQVNLYKWILEKNYGVQVSEMWVVSMHPNYDKYQKFVMPELQTEIGSMFGCFKDKMKKLKNLRI